MRLAEASVGAPARGEAPAGGVPPRRHRPRRARLRPPLGRAAAQDHGSQRTERRSETRALKPTPPGSAGALSTPPEAPLLHQGGPTRPRLRAADVTAANSCAADLSRHRLECLRAGGRDAERSQARTGAPTPLPVAASDSTGRRQASAEDACGRLHLRGGASLRSPGTKWGTLVQRPERAHAGDLELERRDALREIHYVCPPRGGRTRQIWGLQPATRRARVSGARTVHGRPGAGRRGLGRVEGGAQRYGSASRSTTTTACQHMSASGRSAAAARRRQGGGAWSGATWGAAGAARRAHGCARQR